MVYGRQLRTFLQSEGLRRKRAKPVPTKGYTFFLGGHRQLWETRKNKTKTSGQGWVFPVEISCLSVAKPLLKSWPQPMEHTKCCLHKDPEEANPQWFMGKHTNALTFFGVCVCVFALCRGQRTTLGTILQPPYFFYFLKQGLSGSWNLSNGLVWLASEPHDPTWVYLLGAGLTNMYHGSQLFLWVLGIELGIFLLAREVV